MEFATRKMKLTTQRLVIVVVVYRRSWRDVTSGKYLIEQLNNRFNSKSDEKPFQIEKLIVYDNSPTQMAMPSYIDKRIDYKHNPDNGGTRAAYDYALSMSLMVGGDWILLLDQDTFLPDNFLISVKKSITANILNEVDVFFPWITDGGHFISPSYISLSGSIAPYNKKTSMHSFLIKGITGIASGSIIRTSALTSLPPLPSELWLDFVDHWIFNQLKLNGKKYFVLDVTLQHELSIMNMAAVSSQRQFSLLDGERIFVASLGGTARFVYPFRLLLRLVRLVMVSPQTAMNMVNWLWLRLVRKC